MSTSQILRAFLIAACSSLSFTAQAEVPANIRIGLGHQVITTGGRVSLDEFLELNRDGADPANLMSLSESLRPCQKPGYIVDIGGVPVPDERAFEEIVRLSALFAGSAHITCEIGAQRASAVVNPVIETRGATGDWLIDVKPSPDVLSDLLALSMETAVDYGINMGEWRTGDDPDKIVFLENGRESSAYEVRDDHFVGSLFGEDAEDQQLLVEIVKAMGHEPKVVTKLAPDDFPVEITFSAIDPFTFFLDLRNHLGNLFALRFVHSNYHMIATGHDLDRMEGKSNGPEPTRQQILEEALRNFEKLAELAK
ncbi:hypothetical protein AYJ57_20995 (plasmid) [Salipiger sp. CCB-MM3]|uniref:hypothetical protein n=1 Tax=Salipiger sp. CCB-MM3 TaxID=1792508 RepID=UPI00080AADA6|nr:hypothetical protein [Salipiger sp. CCB-MM3]ANT62956.1 hypothetical protein AYJ57_20995 [Salipiger sp. CCB-MM3]